MDEANDHRNDAHRARETLTMATRALERGLIAEALNETNKKREPNVAKLILATAREVTRELGPALSRAAVDAVAALHARDLQAVLEPCAVRAMESFRLANGGLDTEAVMRAVETASRGIEVAVREAVAEAAGSRAELEAAMHERVEALFARATRDFAETAGELIAKAIAKPRTRIAIYHRNESGEVESVTIREE